MPIIAPWTPEFVKKLERYQQTSTVHPYTCPGDRDECKIDRVLIPTTDGWICACGNYMQKWAHNIEG